MNNDKFVDTCRLLGNYNWEKIYLYSSAKYDRPKYVKIHVGYDKIMLNMTHNMQHKVSYSYEFTYWNI